MIIIVKADYMVQAGSDEIRVVKSKPSPCAIFVCSFAILPIHSPRPTIPSPSTSDQMVLTGTEWSSDGEIFGHNRLRS